MAQTPPGFLFPHVLLKFLHASCSCQESWSAKGTAFRTQRSRCCCCRRSGRGGFPRTGGTCAEVQATLPRPPP